MQLIFDSKYVCYVYKNAFSKGLEYKGSPTSVIFGFLKEVIMQAHDNEAENIIFCWDSQKSVRKKVRAEYKHKDPPKLSDEAKELEWLAFCQFDEIRKIVLPGLGFSNIFLQEGYEADDLIASVVKSKPEDYTVISGDEDLYQLLDHCRVHSIKKRATMTPKIFGMQYKITPDQWVDVKAVAGCSGDNVKGLSGVGEKGVIAYFDGSLKTGEKYHKIKNAFDEEWYLENLKLVKLPFEGTMVPVISSNTCTIDKYVELCKEYGFTSLLTNDSVRKWKRICENLRQRRRK
jgi:DNA polymerase-1